MSTNYSQCFTRALVIGVVSGLWWCAVGCSSPPPPGPPRKPTIPVTGSLVIDGQPVEMIEIACHDMKKIETNDSKVSATFTDAQGKFALTTYVEGDGVPEGDYALTFMWGQFDLFSRSYVGPDKLNDRYKSPRESKVKFTAKKGSPVDLGKIELTTK